MVLGFLDSLFLQMEKGLAPEVKGYAIKTSNNKNFNIAKALQGLIDGLDGLDGAWKQSVGKFKEQLINDIKTFLFGKWEKPWVEELILDSNGKLLVPRSIRGKSYSNYNILVLEKAYENSPYFVTPNYVKKHGGKISQPDKARVIIGYVPFFRDTEGNLHVCKGGEEPDLLLPRGYLVISTDYVEGIKIPPFSKVELTKKELIEYAEEFIAHLKKLGRIPKLIYDEKDRCYYAPLSDEIHLVKVDQFKKIEGYYSTLFHEIIHSTKASSRLGRGRPLKDTNQKSMYAAEELVAEMGAMMLSAELGLNYHRQNSISYLKGWLDEAAKRSGKELDSVLLEAYSYAVDAVEYLIDGVDVDALIPHSVKEKASSSLKNIEDKSRNEEKKNESKPDVSPKTINKPKADKPIKNTLPKTLPIKSKQVEIVDVPVKSIFTDEKRFQNRVNAFSEESKNRIVKAVKNGTFDWAKFDPITIWLDPKDKRYYVLSGHSRRAAFIELSKDNPDFSSIPAKLFRGSEKEAIDFALNSNTLATRETEVERALYYAKQRLLCELDKTSLNGKSDCERMVEEQCRENEGKNANYILNLSYLNPNGFLMESLARMGVEKDNDSTNLLRTIANWIGEARRKYPEMTDFHETECAQFLINGGYGNKKNQFKNKTAFLERLEFALARWKNNGAKPVTPLNMANNISKSVFEKEWDDRLTNAKEELDRALSEHEEKYKKYLFAVMEGKITQERMDELMKPLVAQVERAKKEYDRIKGQRDDVAKATSAQTSLWGVDDVNERFNHELDKLIKGNLPENHVFNLGYPEKKLLEAGFCNCPIELRAKTLIIKSSKTYKGSHPFSLAEVKSLPRAINEPIAVFQSLTHSSSRVLLTTITSNNANLVVAIEMARTLKRAGTVVCINDIRSLYPKDYYKDILKWIVEYNLLLWVDKEKALNWISKLRRTAEVAYLAKGATNIIKNFTLSTSGIKNFDETDSLGFINFSEKHNVTTYKLKGDLGKFLGEYDRNRYSIVIRGDKGAGKSRLLFQLINAYASKKYRVAFFSLEMGISSSVTQKYKTEYINPANLKRVDITDTTPTFEQLNDICKRYDVVAIDSWTKLQGLSQSDFDRLQKENPKTIVISIFQSTTSRVTRGGNMPEYDASVVIHVHTGGIAECEKNRFAPCNIKYNVFTQNVIEGEVVENG